MRARVLFAGAVALSTAVLAGPASGKPAIAEASISGPKLDGVIRIQAPDTDGLWEAGIDMGGGRADTRADSVEELGLTSADLGPRYLVTYRFDLSDALIRQDLYPYAKDRPVTYTPPGQKLAGRRSLSITAGWYQSSLDVFDYLVDHGLPETNPVAPIASDEAEPDPASGVQTAPSAGIVLVLVGLAALSLAALAVRRRVLAVSRVNR